MTIAAPEGQKSVRLAVNVSPETARTFRALIKQRGITITEGVRRAIAVWKFIEDETAAGSQLAIVQADGTVRIVELLP